MKFRQLMSVSVLALLASAEVHAQESATTDETGLGEIIVTAQKRSESAQDIPVSVAAVGGAVLESKGVTDLFQAVNLVPGVVFSRAPDDGLALTFRGLGTTARPQAFEQSVALFTDGVFIGKGRLYSTSFFDVDRMEFIKGTQSTLLGKNASLGAVSVVTHQPGDKLSFEGRAGYEVEHGGYTIDAAGDMPIGDGTALRLAAHYNDLDGWVKNDVTGKEGPIRKDLGLRAILRSDVSDNLRLTASYQYANNRQIGASYQIVGAVPANLGDPLLNDHTAQFTSLTNNGDTFHRTRSHIASLKAELDLGSHTLISQTSYIHYKLLFLDDFDFTPEDTFNLTRNEKYRQFSEELRIQSPTGEALEYMAGVFFLDNHWNSQELQGWAVPAFPPPPDPASGQLFNGPFLNSFVQDSKAFSVFASGTYRFTDNFRVAGGVRYTREEKDVVFGRTQLTPATVWNSIANPPFDPTPLSHNSDFYDGNISLQYDLNRNVMAYVSFGHGSKAGGFVETNTIAVPPPALVNGKVPAALVAAGASIKDEKTKTYEVGLKTTLLDRKLRFNIAGFWSDIKNFQDTVFTGGPLGFITFNGPSRSRGVEIETALQATHELRFDGGLTYADATGVIQPIDPATSAPQVDGSGNPVYGRYRRSQAPKLIFNIGANYTTALNDAMDFHIDAGLPHRSSMYNQRQELFPSKQLTTVDVTVGIASSENRWGIDLIAKNIGDARSEDFASPTTDPRLGAFYGAYLAGPNAARTITIAARFKY